jgi:hypothetical protein
VPADFKNEFKQNLMVYNQNALDDVQITVILAKKKSQSEAGELPKKGEGLALGCRLLDY